MDLVSVSFVDKIGYRASMILAHLTAAAGLILITILPEVLPSPFFGILSAVLFPVLLLIGILKSPDNPR